SDVDPDELDMIMDLAEDTAGDDLDYYFMDLTFWKYITSSEVDQLTESPTPIKVTITIPEDYRGGVDYFMIRVHDGKAQVLDSKYDADAQTVSFKTDLFSTYALVRVNSTGSQDETDETGDGTGGTDIGGGTITDNGTGSTTGTTSGGSTGDNSMTYLWILIICIAAAAVIAVIAVRRRKRVS
ncbi:MAG: hypothetical protein LUC41_08220, partial [Clostridiales bacterium]|nr:hypothetical protein [Clostridiales bacterium]